jgi:hypothetical protein
MGANGFLFFGEEGKIINFIFQISKLLFAFNVLSSNIGIQFSIV